MDGGLDGATAGDLVHEPEVEPPLSYEVHARLDAGAIIAARR
jgi:hypothetical protein